MLHFTGRDLEQTTPRLLRVLVALLGRPGHDAGRTRKIRACLCGLLGNLMETLDRRDGAQLVQCHVLVRDEKRHWRIRVCLVPVALGVRTGLRVRTIAERLRTR